MKRKIQKVNVDVGGGEYNEELKRAGVEHKGRGNSVFEVKGI